MMKYYIHIYTLSFYIIYTILYKRYCSDIYCCDINCAFIGYNKNNKTKCTVHALKQSRLRFLIGKICLKEYVTCVKS
jgi:hypothetical protein